MLYRIWLGCWLFVAGYLWSFSRILVNLFCFPLGLLLTGGNVAGHPSGGTRYDPVLVRHRHNPVPDRVFLSYSLVLANFCFEGCLNGSRFSGPPAVPSRPRPSLRLWVSFLWVSFPVPPSYLLRF